MEVGVGLARDPPRLLQRVGERGSDSAVLSSPLLSSDPPYCAAAAAACSPASLLLQSVLCTHFSPQVGFSPAVGAGGREGEHSLYSPSSSNPVKSAQQIICRD